MSKINWELIARQLAEAREQLEELEKLVHQPRKRIEGLLQIGLEHAYHHLNFAWNARKMTQAQNEKLSSAQFRSKSAYPKSLRPIGTDPPARRVRARQKQSATKRTR